MDQFFTMNLLQNLSLYTTALTGAVLASLWISLIFWAYRDMRSRTRDRLVQILASVMVGILFIPGVLIYLFLRPAMTLDQVYLRTLEEEALLVSIEENRNCPGCGSRADQDWQYCPLCYTRLAKTCDNCSHQMELSWQLCPYCGTATPGSRATVKPSPESTDPDTQGIVSPESVSLTEDLIRD